jgi:predicted transcriptional regulator
MRNGILQNMGQQDDMLLAELTSRIVVAYVRKHIVPIDEMQKLISGVHSNLTSISRKAAVPKRRCEDLRPAVPIVTSLQPHQLLCLECGRSLKVLKRHLKVHHQSTPQQYREKWSLPRDYPMVSSSYSVKRSRLAKAFGLGRNHRAEQQGVGSGRSRPEYSANGDDQRPSPHI